MRGMSGLAITILAAAMQTGNTGTPSGFQVAAETANFVFYTRGAAKVDGAKNQRFLEETARNLGTRIEGKKAYIRYEWSEELAFVVGQAAAGASGAYMENGDVHSTKEFDAHEIVHRVAFQLGNPGSFFQEGLAVELGDGGRYGRLSVDEIARKLAGRVEFKALVTSFTSVAPEARYPLAGSFVRSLVRKHGLETVAEFFKACDGPQAAEAQFARVFGTSLESAGAEWLKGLGR